MDFLKDAASKFGDSEQQGKQGDIPGTGEAQQTASSQGSNSGGGGFLSGIGDKLNSAAGGGKESEKNEDYLDK
jgi:hypothetical protein